MSKKYRVRLRFDYERTVGFEVVVEVPDGEELEDVIDKLWCEGKYLGEGIDPDVRDYEVYSKEEFDDAP